MTDGGPENVNELINNFVNDESVPIKHIIAGLKVNFSNSMVEACNKIMKYQYLFTEDIKDLNHLLARKYYQGD